MPYHRITYYCAVCHTAFNTEEDAATCEATPTKTKLKVGQEVLICSDAVFAPYPKFKIASLSFDKEHNCIINNAYNEKDSIIINTDTLSWTSVADCDPPDREYVLVHLTKNSYASTDVCLISGIYPAYIRDGLSFLHERSGYQLQTHDLWAPY